MRARQEEKIEIQMGAVRIAVPTHSARLTANGLFLKLPRPLRMHTEATLRITGGKTPLEIKGKVWECYEEVALTFRTADLAPSEQRKWIRWLASRGPGTNRSNGTRLG